MNVQTIEKLIETGDSEQIFQKAIQEQGRGRVCRFALIIPSPSSVTFFALKYKRWMDVYT